MSLPNNFYGFLRAKYHNCDFLTPMQIQNPVTKKLMTAKSPSALRLRNHVPNITNYDKYKKRKIVRNIIYDFYFLFRPNCLMK